MRSSDSFQEKSFCSSTHAFNFFLSLSLLSAVGIRFSSSSDHMAVLFTDDDSAKDGYVNGVS